MTRVAREQIRTGIGRLAAPGVVVSILTLLPAGSRAAGVAGEWRMHQRDAQHTGRADYTVPAARMNDTFFDYFAWQTPSPDSPWDGSFGGVQMTFMYGAGPDNADLVLGTYHWPKGILGLDCHTGRTIWSGSIEGGETIGECTPAFRGDGEKIYVVNDATEDQEYPNGHPLMSFWSADGPQNFIHNGSWQDPRDCQMPHLTVGMDDLVFSHSWGGTVHAGWDNNQELFHQWHANTYANVGQSSPAACAIADWHIVVGTRDWDLVCWDYWGNEHWRMGTPCWVDASPTIDPTNSNVYVPCGENDIYLVGLNHDGVPLWGQAAVLIHAAGGGSGETSRATGCLSHDGSTFYFSTVGGAHDGALYAVNTSDGGLKWRQDIGSWTNWQERLNSPIVTENGIVVVGNNDGCTYFAIRDAGDHGEILDTLVVDAGTDGRARPSASLSPDGILYLPLRVHWAVGNGNGAQPTFQVTNVYSAIDLTENPSVTMFSPQAQRAYAGNHQVELKWHAILAPPSAFSHYAVYRDIAPFTSVTGMTPVMTVADVSAAGCVDVTAENGVSYYYAVTSVGTNGSESTVDHSVGPRTPWDETDLQVVSISRTPRFERYNVAYTGYEEIEPGGFGPYSWSAATGLWGQDETTPREPNIGAPVTYTATVRNRGTNHRGGSLTVKWDYDGYTVASGSYPIDLDPGETTVFSVSRAWQAGHHTVRFEMIPSDARPANDQLAIDTRSVAFLSYIDRSWIEEIREDTPNHPLAVTDDAIDWMNHHMAKFNQLFQDAGVTKRVHYDVLEVIEDDAPDPQVPTIQWAVFPFRWASGGSQLRYAGYYDANDDIDWGLLHEWGHQLGMIDIYQINLAPEQNEVSHEGYWARQCLMHGCSHFLSDHTIQAMAWWGDKAHGYFGQYLYSIPETIKMRMTGTNGRWLCGAHVKVYQMCERPGIGKVLTNQVKFEGTVDDYGCFTFPNVPIDTTKVPTTYLGDKLKPNPFGYVAVIATNALLLVEVEFQGIKDYTWLDLTDVNLAYWAGQTGTAIIDRDFELGDEIQIIPPEDMTELSASNWVGWADDSWYTLTDDPARRQVGSASVRINTGGGFDTYARYPRQPARWDLTETQWLHAWFYAENENGFQGLSPWIILRAPGGEIELHPNDELLNPAIGNWVHLDIPLAGDAVWTRTVTGTPDITQVRSLEVHIDTWDFGFTVWMDGVGFDTVSPAEVASDIPMRLALLPATPNPSGGVTTIRYDLPARASLSLAVFDATGRRVRVLAEQEMPPGRHLIAWDGKDQAGRALPSGVYLVRMEAVGRELRQKIVRTSR